MDYSLNQNNLEQKPKKHIPTWLGLVIIIIVAVVAFGAVFAYQYNAGKSQIPISNIQTNPNTQTVNTQTAGWKTYTNAEYGFEFKYPQILKLSESDDVVARRVILSHSVAYKHNDPCDFKGDKPQLENLFDFNIWFNIIDTDIKSAISGKYQGHPEQKVNLGGFNGYKYMVGVEYCGMNYYYLSITPQKTLWISSSIITELSPILPKDEVNKYLAIPGILNTEDSDDLLNQIVSTFKFIK